MGKAPILYIEQQIMKSCTEYVKLQKYVFSNERLTKNKLKQLLENLKKPLFNSLEGISPSEENNNLTK